MISKVFIRALLVIGTIWSTPMFSNSNLVDNSVGNVEQKQISKIEDFIEVEKALKEAVNLGDSSKFMALGSLYLEDFSFKKRDTEKAKFYLEKALNENQGLASLPLSYLSIENNDLDSAFIVLDRGIRASEKDLNAQIILAVFFNGLVLDHKNNDLRYVHKALDLTYPISQKTNKSALDFTVANLLNLAGNTAEANKYLNTACNNPEIDAELKKTCDDSLGITNNIKKSHECNTCGVLK